jgi:hypothetical protein
MTKRILMAALLAASVTGSAVADEWADQFRNPPETARSWVYWWWLNGAVSREGLFATWTR